MCAFLLFFFSDGIHTSPSRIINDWIQIQNLFLFIHSTVG